MSESTSETLLKKKATKKKATAGEVEQADLIVATATELENMTQEQAFNEVRTLSDNVDYTYFRLGGVLAVIQGNSDWWRDTGAETFRQFIEDHFGIHYRKAMYLINIYAALVESGVPFDKLAGLGWSKVKELTPVITLDNADEWVERASNLTVLQLNEAVKKAKEGTLEKSDETPGEAKGVTTFTAKVHPDQKATIEQAIEQAMKEADTEFKGVALEAICLNYLSGAKVSKPLSLAEVMKKHTYEEVLNAFSKQWPEVDLTVSV